MSINPKHIPGRYSKWSSRSRPRTLKGAYQKGYRAGRRWQKEQFQFEVGNVPEPFAFLRNGRWYPWRYGQKYPIDGIIFYDGRTWDSKNGWRPFTFSPARLDEIREAWRQRKPEELILEEEEPVDESAAAE